jgi:hypothetical protein
MPKNLLGFCCQTIYVNIEHFHDHQKLLVLGIIRAGLDLESGLKNGLGWKKSTPLIGGEVGTRLFKFTP